MAEFIKIVYSNQAIINQRKLKFHFTLILFIVSLMLVVNPFIMARLTQTPQQLMDQFPQVENGLMQVLNEFDCSVENNTLSCNQGFTEKELNGVTYFINAKEGQELQATQEYVLLSDKQVIFKNVNSTISGDYSLLEGQSFDDLLAMKESEGATDQEFVGHLLQNFHQSTLGTQIPMTIISIFIQYTIYVLLVSGVFLAINLNKLQEPISFMEMINMNVMAMFSPALISAVIGLFSPENATALFPLIYMARIIMLYFKLMRRPKVV